MTKPLDILADLIADARKAGADAADALLYESTALSVSRRMRNPEGLERSESKGVSLRVFTGNRSAMTSSSDTAREALAEMLARAMAMAKLAPEDASATLAPMERLARTLPDLDLYDTQEPSPQWLQEQCAKAEDAALSVAGITNSQGADASYNATHFALCASNGFAGEYRMSSASLSSVVLAGEGTAMERDYDFSAARHARDLTAAEQIGQTAAQRALARLNPRKAPTQQASVVYDPRVSKGLLGAFAGAINGSAIARGTSFLKDCMGKPVFGKSVTIIDDPHRRRGLGSKPFDGEGVANAKTALVEAGALQSWLLDMRSANKLGLATTGHAARGLSAPPSPSATNLHMAPGKLSPEALIADIKSGFYVTDLFGGGVNTVTGDYSQGGSGFWIENGRKAFPVSEVTIAGRLQDMFARLIPANDLTFRYAVNAPTLRIDGLTVAGGSR